MSYESSVGFNQVYALVMLGSDLYAGGRFTTAGGVAAKSIAKWNGGSWSALGSGMDTGILYPAIVSALAVSGSEVYAGGYFATAGGVAAGSMAKWNGSSWSALGSGLNATSFTAVKALAVSGAGLYAGGGFTAAGGLPATGIAKWNGASWSALGSEVMNNVVYAMAMSGTDLYLGGQFTAAGGLAANHIAKWNGSNWNTLGLGMNYYVYALAMSGNDLFAGGGFTMAGGVPANHIAKWNGSSWSALGSGITNEDIDVNVAVSSLAVSGNDLYAGGWFQHAGGVPANSIAKWDGVNWSALGSGVIGADDRFGPNVSALAVSETGSDLYPGGAFTVDRFRRPIFHAVEKIAAAWQGKWSIVLTPSRSVDCRLCPAVSASPQSSVASRAMRRSIRIPSARLPATESSNSQTAKAGQCAAMPASAPDAHIRPNCSNGNHAGRPRRLL